MAGTNENLVLRQIQITDNPDKLSLGHSAYIPLKTFLKKDAFDFHQYDIAKTYVLINPNISSPPIQGYISLMSSEILLNEGQKPQETTRTLKYTGFPAIKIARLAIDKKLQGCGYGAMLLAWCINHIKIAIMPHIGCRYLIVDAKKHSVSFYQKSGFILLNTKSNHEDEQPLMFFDLHKENESA